MPATTSDTATRRPALRRLGRVSLVVAIALASGIASLAITTPDGGRASAAPAGAGGEYHSIAPARILDTRSGIGAPTAPQGAKALTTGAGSSFSVQVLGEGGLPADGNDVLAVVANVTVTGPTQSGYLRIFGTGGAEGNSSLVNFQAGQTVPNMTILRPGADGRADVRLVGESGNGEAHVLIDVFGWFSTDGYDDRGARLISVGPGRIYDSRNPTFGNQQPVGTDGRVTVEFRGADSLAPATNDIVPQSSNVVGALVNVTAVNNLPGSLDTFVSVLPEAPPAGQWPATSNLNLRRGQIKANLALVPVGADGDIRLFNQQGDVHLIVDVVAFLRTGDPVGTSAGRVVPLVSPFRAIDTRLGQFGARPLGEGAAEDWSFDDFVTDVEIDGEWVGAQSALLGNLTATDLTPRFEWADIDTFMTAYPSSTDADAEPPEASNINLTEGEAVPNMVLLKYGTGNRTVDGTQVSDPYMVRMYNYAGSVHYILDVSAVVLADS